MLVTVYITNYNYADFLEESIHSVLNQTLQDFELLIIDDGSTDHSREILNKYEEHVKVSVIYQQNKGLNVTNNIALKASKAKYIVRLDADDYFAENALEVMVNRLESDEELGLVFPDYFHTDIHGGVIEHHARHDFDTEVSLFDQVAHGACTMVRVSFLRSVGGYNEKFSCQDGYELWVKFTQKYKVSNIREPLFYYRQHGSNLTGDERRILNTRAAINEHYSQELSIESSSLVIIPIRTEQHFVMEEIGGEKIIDVKIKNSLNSTKVELVVVVSNSDDIHQYLKEMYEGEERLLVVKRSKSASRLNVDLSVTIDQVLDDEKVRRAQFFNIVLLSVEFPFSDTQVIDDAINTLHLFQSDSLVTVRLENSMMFQHHGDGMVPILNQDKFQKIEREALYKNIGSVSVVKKDFFIKNKKVLSGRVGHIVLSTKAAWRVSSVFDLKMARLMTDI